MVGDAGIEPATSTMSRSTKSLMHSRLPFGSRRGDSERRADAVVVASLGAR